MILLIQTSCGSADEARAIAEALVAERLAACVQIAPVESVYRWQGAVERAGEWRLEIKTAAAFETVRARIVTLHSYDLPEVIGWPVQGSADYLGWVEVETATFNPSPLRGEGGSAEGAEG